MKLSAVIPVYNAERYLPELLDSLKNQTNKDFEVSIVNDGSTDKSGDLIEQFIRDNPEIKVIYNKIPNSGQGAARELGIKSATNKYICFIDADDYLESNYFETFDEIITKYQPDLVCSNHFVNDKKVADSGNFPDKLLNEEDIKNTIYPYLIHTARYSYFRPNLWAKVFRKDLYLNNICKENIRVGEDIAVFVPTFLECKSVYLCSKHLYHYRVNDESVMNTKKPRNYSDVINLYNHLKAKLTEEQYQYFELQIDRLIAHVAFNCSTTQFYGRDKKEAKEIISKNLDNEIISKAIEAIDAKGLKAKLMRYALKHKKYGLMKLYSKVM